jgi:hypothetical protein
MSVMMPGSIDPTIVAQKSEGAWRTRLAGWDAHAIGVGI